MGGFAGTHIDRAEGSEAGCNVVALPTDAQTRFRLLHREIDELLGDAGGGCARVEDMRFARRTMHIDDHASVFTGASVSDFHFSLETREGRKVLLITGDIAIMARFVAAYLIRRHECSPELAAHL